SRYVATGPACGSRPRTYQSTRMSTIPPTRMSSIAARKTRWRIAVAVLIQAASFRSSEAAAATTTASSATAEPASAAEPATAAEASEAAAGAATAAAERARGRAEHVKEAVGATLERAAARIAGLLEVGEVEPATATAGATIAVVAGPASTTGLSGAP